MTWLSKQLSVNNGFGHFCLALDIWCYHFDKRNSLLHGFWYQQV